MTTARRKKPSSHISQRKIHSTSLPFPALSPQGSVPQLKPAALRQWEREHSTWARHRRKGQVQESLWILTAYNTKYADSTVTNNSFLIRLLWLQASILGFASKVHLFPCAHMEIACNDLLGIEATQSAAWMQPTGKVLTLEKNKWTVQVVQHLALFK